MFRQSRIHLTALAVLVMAPACATDTQTGSTRHTLDEVPAAARAALDHQANGAELIGVEKETERGAVVYEGAWMANGAKNEAKVTADGTLVELEQAIAVADVPEAVQAEVTRRYPTATEIAYVKKVFYVSGESVNYEIELRADGRRHEFLLTPDGAAAKDPTDEGEEDDEDDEGDDD